ncbi:MAG: iron transporter, partial [Oscillospiraceae bacterium]|nr:iron transporter [Oscillospiraceae bacterium]
MTKKLVGIALLASMALSLTACGGNTESTSTAENTASVAETAAQAQADDNSSEADVTSAEAVDAEINSEAAADAPSPDGEAGFTEIPIFEDIETGFLNVSAVYFQPVPMSGGNESIEGFDLHLEADVSALENKLGFGVGDWVPYMTVDYRVIASDGSDAAKGSFMVMSASDGPHYGAN